MIELKVPPAGESITEVVIVEWLKGEGTVANQDEPVALIETDKANVEVLAPQRGRIGRILKKAGETARVGEVIGMLEEEGAHPLGPLPKEQIDIKPKENVLVVDRKDGASAGTPPAPAPAIVPPSPPAALPPAAIAAAVASSGRNGVAGIAVAPPPDPALETSNHLRMTPATRRALREAQKHGGSPGLGPQISPAVPQPGAARADAPATARADAPATARADAPAPRLPAPTDGRALDRREDVVPMTPLRRRVADRLVEAQQTAALLTTFNEIDMSAVIALRKQHQDTFVARHGVKLGFMSFFVKAAIEALRAFPAINAEIRGTDIVYHRYYDIGVAVGGGKGLVVPIVRSAEQLSFAEIEKMIADFGARARDSKLKVEELQGGTFTISNGGIYGSMMSTPIVNPPQSGILGMHAIQERPVARNGAVVIAPMMYVALTYDHRIVDGREAVGFLVRIKECVENPTRILLEV